MLNQWMTRLFGSKNDRVLKRIQPMVEAVNQCESTVAALDDGALAGRTAIFRQRLENGEPLDALIPEAFATVREASRRTLNMRHFDVQLIGGIVLHEGKIAEMKTGEGKTLVATLAAYLNALSGRGVHVDPTATQGVEVGSQCGHQGLSLTGLHFGDLALVEYDPTNELNVKMAHVQGPARGFTNRGEGFGNQRVQRFAVFQPLAEDGRPAGQRPVVESRNGRFTLVDGFDHRLDAL